MTLQKLLSLTRKAVDEFQLIDEGDKIAIGISGGKDSLTMLYLSLIHISPQPCIYIMRSIYKPILII